MLVHFTVEKRESFCRFLIGHPLSAGKVIVTPSEKVFLEKENEPDNNICGY